MAGNSEKSAGDAGNGNQEHKEDKPFSQPAPDDEKLSSVSPTWPFTYPVTLRGAGTGGTNIKYEGDPNESKDPGGTEKKEKDRYIVDKSHRPGNMGILSEDELPDRFRREPGIYFPDGGVVICLLIIRL